MKFLIFLIFVTANLYADIEGEAGAYSNFIWRGTTFSNNKPAVQLELDAQAENGLFIGTFVSNAEFSDEAMSADSDVTSEADFMAGKRWYGDLWEIQASYNYFTFPDAGVFNTDEFNLQGKFGSYLLELSYMDDYFGYQGVYKYVRIGKEWAFKDSILSGLFLGYNSFSKPKGSVRSRCLDAQCMNVAETTSGAGNPDYIDVFLVNRKILKEGISVELAVNWTNRKEYTVEEGAVEKVRAKDFTTVVAIILPFTL